MERLERKNYQLILQCQQIRRQRRLEKNQIVIQYVQGMHHKLIIEKITKNNNAKKSFIIKAIKYKKMNKNYVSYFKYLVKAKLINPNFLNKL